MLPRTASTVTWAQRMERDPSLAAFVAAEIAPAGVNPAAWRAEADHWHTLLRRERDQLRLGVDAAAWRAEADHWHWVSTLLRRERDRLRAAEGRTTGRKRQAGPVAVHLPGMSGPRE